MEFVKVSVEAENVVVKNTAVASENNIRRTCPD